MVDGKKSRIWQFETLEQRVEKDLVVGDSVPVALIEVPIEAIHAPAAHELALRARREALIIVKAIVVILACADPPAAESQFGDLEKLEQQVFTAVPPGQAS
jgi:hypothetical protein